MITEYAVTVHGDTRDQVAASMLIEACKHFGVNFRLIARLIHAVKPEAHLTTGQKEKTE